MRFTFLIVATPLTLLAACDGSGTDEGSTQREGTESSAAIESTSGAPAPSTTANSPQTTGQPSPPAAFAQCKTCHSIEPGKNGVGPTLFGIVGSKAGEVPGYSFSPALAGSGIVWDRESLDEWMQGPMKMVPGTKMVIAQPDPEKRKAIIDYLETLK